MCWKRHSSRERECQASKWRRLILLATEAAPSVPTSVSVVVVVVDIDVVVQLRQEHDRVLHLVGLRLRLLGRLSRFKRRLRGHLDLVEALQAVVWLELFDRREPRLVDRRLPERRHQLPAFFGVAVVDADALPARQDPADRLDGRVGEGVALPAGKQMSVSIFVYGDLPKTLT